MEEGGVSEGVTLSWRQSCTNLRKQMYTQTLLVVLKPAENCCSSVKSLPVLLLERKKMAPLRLSLLAARDKSLSFPPNFQLSLQVLASRFCLNSPPACSLSPVNACPSSTLFCNCLSQICRFHNLDICGFEMERRVESIA